MKILIGGDFNSHVKSEAGGFDEIRCSESVS